APVYSLTGEGEEEEGEEEEGDDVEGEEGQAAAADGEAAGDAQAAVEVEESIETEKPAEDTATETIPEATASDTGEKDIPPEDSNPDAAAVEPVAEESSPDVPATQQPSDLPQEEAASAILTASEPPVEEETAAESTETAPQESESDIVPEPQPEEEEAHASDPAPSDIIDGVEPNHQDSGNILEDANASQGGSAASDVPAPVEIVEDEKQTNENSESSPEAAQENQADGSQPPGAEAQDLEQNVIDVAEVLDPSADKSHPVDSSGGDISQEGLPSHDISTVEQHPIAEYDATPPEAQSREPITCPKETDETVTVEGPTASENIQDTSPEDCNEIVQVIDVNNNDSTDDTAAIIVVDVDTPNTLENTISPPPPPPPPPPAPHVTISEPVKPSKSSKKKSSSSKSSKSRHGEKPKEKAVEIIPLKKGKVKTVAKGKSKKKVKGKDGKGSDSDSGEVIPPPPPPLLIVDVPPLAPSPPPSGHVIEVVEVEEMQVIDAIGGKDEAEDVVVRTTDSSLPDVEVDAADTAADKEPPIEDVSGEKEESNRVVGTDTATPPGEEVKIPEIVQVADTAIVAVPDQPEKDELTPVTADPSSDPDADASEGAEIEQTVEAEAPEQKDDDAPADISSMPEVDITAPALDEEDH
ncbi:hypothetical protein KCU67_g11280, partial [Aureobasidium melanogenum]